MKIKFGTAVNTICKSNLEYLELYSDGIEMVINKGDDLIGKSVKSEGTKISRVHGKTLLMYASQVGDAKIVDFLLRKGADPNIVNNNITALILAIKYKHLQVAKKLVKNGALVNYPEGKTTALEYAKVEAEVSEDKISKGIYNFLKEYTIPEEIQQFRETLIEEMDVPISVRYRSNPFEAEEDSEDDVYDEYEEEEYDGKRRSSKHNKKPFKKSDKRHPHYWTRSLKLSHPIFELPSMLMPGESSFLDGVKNKRSDRKSRLNARKSKRSVRKSKRSVRKSKRSSRKSKRSVRKSKRSSRKSRRSARKSKRSVRKSRRSVRKSRRIARKSKRRTRKTRSRK